MQAASGIGNGTHEAAPHESQGSQFVAPRRRDQRAAYSKMVWHFARMGKESKESPMGLCASEFIVEMGRPRRRHGRPRTRKGDFGTDPVARCQTSRSHEVLVVARVRSGQTPNGPRGEWPCGEALGPSADNLQRTRLPISPSKRWPRTCTNGVLWGRCLYSPASKLARLCTCPEDVG